MIGDGITRLHPEIAIKSLVIGDGITRLHPEMLTTYNLLLSTNKDQVKA